MMRRFKRYCCCADGRRARWWNPKKDRYAYLPGCGDPKALAEARERYGY